MDLFTNYYTGEYKKGKQATKNTTTNTVRVNVNKIHKQQQ